MRQSLAFETGKGRWRCILAGAVLCMAFAQPRPSLGADGFLVSASYRSGQKDWQPIVLESNNDAMKGRLCRFNIVDSRIVSCDTIFYGMGQYPCISWDGTRVAFFRHGIYREDVGNTLEGWSNPSTTHLGTGQTGVDELYGTWDKRWVSLIEADGSIRNLVEMPNAPSSEAGIDWPTGDWIFYVNGEVEIRKVNAVTGEDQHVGNPPSDYARRFAMTMDGTAAAMQADGNNIYSVPGFNSLYSMPACNIGVSGSGRYAGHYMGGRHLEIFVHEIEGYFGNGVELQLRPSFWNAADWGEEICFTRLDVDTMIGAEVIRWSVNSDKWITQTMGWWGHAGNLIKGGNSVLINWVDREALCGGGNPRIYQDGVLKYGNCAGDFYVTGHPGKYENSEGVWYTMPGYDPQVVPATEDVEISVDQGGGSASETVTMTFKSGAPTLSVSDNRDWLSATVEGSGSSQSIAVTGNSAGLSMGNYTGVVTITGPEAPILLNVVFRVNGPAVLTTISFPRDTLYVRVGGDVQFTPALLDQFEQPIAGSVSWSVGGGSIGANGLYTSDGTLGIFEVTATSGSITGQAWVWVTQNKPLPLEGYLTELLCLETGAGSVELPVDDAAAIRDAHSGGDRIMPADGVNVSVNGNTYTWKLREDADGSWADVSTYDPFFAYFYTTLNSSGSQGRRAQIITSHAAHFRGLNNGEQFTRSNFFANNIEDWAAQFTVTPEGNGILMELENMWGGNQLRVRFANPVTKLPLGGVQYYPPGQTPSQEIAQTGKSAYQRRYVKISPGLIRIVGGGEGIGRIAICRPDGACVRSRDAARAGEAAISTANLSKGIYLLRVLTPGQKIARRFVVR